MSKSVIEFQTVGWNELEANFDGGREIVLGGMNRMLRRIGQLLVPALKKNTPTGATNRLRNYTTSEIIGKSEDMRLEIRQSARSKKEFPYGEAVRQGARPHFPPYEELTPWVKRKMDVDAINAPRVAFLVARKISMVGTKKNPYHVKTVEGIMSNMRSIVNEEFTKVTSDLATLK